MKKSFALGVLLQSAAVFAANNYRIPYAPIGEGSYELTGKVDMFSSSGYYDHDGLEEALGDDESYNIIDSKIKITYGYGESLQFIGGLGLRSVSAEYLLNSEVVTASKSGLESAFGGIRYSWQSGAQLFYSLDLIASQTLYDNSDYSSTSDIPDDEISLGDAGNSYEVGLGASYLLNKDWMLNFRGAFRQPGNDLSPEVAYLAESAWTWSSMNLVLGVDGVYSLGGDEYSDNFSGKPAQGRAPSYMYNSINRVIVEPRAQIGWGFGSWRLDFYGSQVVAGVSTDKGTRLGIQLTKLSQSNKKVLKKDASFKEYSIEATVLKVSPKGRFVQIDQGISQDIEKGMKFDFYETDFFGGNELIATGIAYEVRLNRSIVKVVKRYSKKLVHKGYTARARLAE